MINQNTKRNMLTLEEILPGFVLPVARVFTRRCAEAAAILNLVKALALRFPLLGLARFPRRLF